ncbi:MULTISPECIES: hypothetical protein [Neorhizobium]|jgi:hypothetical protein|uniref:hypothetical protein n=1 Tax=Neorhizobium sp. T6_25 TaxID=2093833 RepID=UPI001FDFA3BB|nr:MULTISPECIES: hypothetical protein [Neorhizobium]
MTDIPAPTVALGDENRHQLCQMAIEMPLQDLIQAAVKAGWDEPEVLTAIIEVADNLMLAHGCERRAGCSPKGTEAEPGVTVRKKAHGEFHAFEVFRVDRIRCASRMSFRSSTVKMPSESLNIVDLSTRLAPGRLIPVPSPSVK